MEELYAVNSHVVDSVVGAFITKERKKAIPFFFFFYISKYK